ncbi:DUF6257 family protein [Streptomyces sp. NPDC085479]|uniref:DUF6257 family protein n=1 Tax=Streptomyces sp. NPDC085479 TaxID=3365726 RepID=UPI0037D5AC59
MAGKKNNNDYDPNHPPLTVGEGVQFGLLIARMAKRGIAGDNVYQGDLEKKVDRLLDRARDRAEKNQPKRK